MDGSTDTQITSGDVSFVEPDVHASGRLVVCRIRSQSDIWKCPVSGSAAENTRAMTPVTRQTGQVQTPSVSPDGSELVYLSDNGGHANLWVIRTDGTRARQITFERDPAVTIGVPKMVPGRRCHRLHREPRVAAVVGGPSRRPRCAKARRAGLWASVVRRRPMALLHAERRWRAVLASRRSRSPVARRYRRQGRPAIRTRRRSGEDVLYFAAFVAPEFGSLRLGDQAGISGGRAIGAGRSGRRELACRSRRCTFIQHCRETASGSRRRLDRWRDEQPLDAVNQGRLWRQVTDFGDQPTLIVRQVSWSPDGQYLYAAISKNNGDIVMLRRARLSRVVRENSLRP